MSLLIKNVSQIVQVVSDGRSYITKNGFKKLAVIEHEGHEEKLSVIVDKWVKPENLIKRLVNS